MGYTIDIDTGGTFTDGFFVQGETVETVKVPTTPHDLTVCFLDCIKAGAKRFGVSVEDLLYKTDIVRFSNTIGTNTIIQRDGTKIGLLVTAGREDQAPTRTDNGKSPLVWPDMVIGIGEEVSQNGEVIKAPNEQLTLEAAQKLIDQGARCLVAAFANSEFNPASEQLVRQVIKREYPRDYLGSVPVFLSSDISRRSGQQDRVNAAVLNAYIHARLVRLLYKAGEELRRRLYPKSLFIVHNNGSVARVAKTRAINTYNSGPAAGLLGARLIGQLYGTDDLISMDMGGTSFDLGYVLQGQPSYTLNPEVEGLAVNMPMLDIRTIGAGGGSIASIKDGGVKVGPQSAGALPGPVCFDLGGTEPTVTDADLILGILDPDYFLGGTMNLNLEKATEVVTENIAKPLGISVEEASQLIENRVNESMGKEVKRLLKEMGSDQEPLLVVYGGAGPAHCCGIARVAGLKKIIITPFSAVFSAFASSSMDVGHLYYRRVTQSFDDNLDVTALIQPLAEMRDEAERDMRGEGFSADQVLFSLELFVQASKDGPEIRLSAQEDSIMNSAGLKDLVTRATNALSATGTLTSEGLMLRGLGLMVEAPVPHYQIREVPEAPYEPEQARKGSRPIFLEETKEREEVPVYDWSRLQYGHAIDGPAVVESEHTTLLVMADWRLQVDQYNNAVLEEV